MPDRYGEPPADDRDRAQDIAACTLCDDRGIRNNFRCDHTDHAEAARRGMALIRAAMGWADDE